MFICSSRMIDLGFFSISAKVHQMLSHSPTNLTKKTTIILKKMVVLLTKERKLKAIIHN